MTDFQKFALLRPDDILNSIKSEAHLEGFKLLDLLNNKNQKIATAESLTAGLIFSTLVDIPYSGSVKYGCFGVYDTDAKRIFLGVKNEDVYTARCAAEMAVGVLKNSNASFAIAVSGNAMAYQGLESNEFKKQGEVFISVATYSKDKKIIVATKIMNMCYDNYDNDQTPEAICNIWIDKIISDIEVSQKLEDERHICPKLKAQLKNINSGYNNYIITSILSNIIRYKTTLEAYKFANNFISKFSNKINDSDINKNTLADPSEFNSFYQTNNILLKDKENIKIIDVNKDKNIIKNTDRIDRYTAEFKKKDDRIANISSILDDNISSSSIPNEKIIKERELLANLKKHERPKKRIPRSL